MFSYLYRDGSNYKQWGSIVFKGRLTDSLGHRFRRALESEEFFIADQIRVKEVFPESWPIYADDHCWHSFAEFEITNEPRNDEFTRTIEMFVKEAERARVAGWRDFDPLDRRMPNYR